MTEAMFVAANRGIGGEGGDPPEDVMRALYRSVRRFPLSVQPRSETRPFWEGELTLVHRGWGATTFRPKQRRWGVLTARALYLYASRCDAEPVATCPLDGLRVLAHDSRQVSLQYCCQHCPSARVGGVPRLRGQARRAVCVHAISYHYPRQSREESLAPPEKRPLDLAKFRLEAASAGECRRFTAELRRRLFEEEEEADRPRLVRAPRLRRMAVIQLPPT